MTTLKPRVSVICLLESTDELKLQVKRIQIIDGGPELGDLVFTWFVQTGDTIEYARDNAHGAIAFYLRCRTDLQTTILNALEPEAARGVRARLGINEDEEETRSRR